MRSIRSRLTIMLVIGMGVLLVGAGALLRSELNSRLQEEFDRGLLGAVEGLKALIEDEGDETEFDFSDEIMPAFSRIYQPQELLKKLPKYFQLWFQSDKRIEKSASLNSHDLPRWPEIDPEPKFRDITLPNQHHVRLVQVSFLPKMEELDDSDETEDEDRGPQESTKANEREEAAEESTLDARPFPDRAVTLIVARDRTQLDEFIIKLNWFLAGLMIALLIIIVVL